MRSLASLSSRKYLVSEVNAVQVGVSFVHPRRRRNVRNFSAGWHFLLGTALCVVAWLLSSSNHSIFWPSIGLLLAATVSSINYARGKRTSHASFGPAMRQSAIVLALLFLIAPLHQDAFGVISGYLVFMGCGVVLCQIRRRSVISWSELWQ